MELLATREHIAQIGLLLFERQLTDAAGGNISVRVGDRLCMTPRYAGTNWHWRLAPEQILILDLAGSKLEGEGEVSRETKVHVALHQQFQDYGDSVLHCHARNIMPFAAMSQPIRPILEANQPLGEIPVASYAPSHTDGLANYICDAMSPQAHLIHDFAAGVLAPWHGLFVMGKDLNSAFDAAERWDTNAYCLLMARLLGSEDAIRHQQHTLREAYRTYRE